MTSICQKWRLKIAFSMSISNSRADSSVLWISSLQMLLYKGNHPGILLKWDSVLSLSWAWSPLLLAIYQLITPLRRKYGDWRDGSGVKITCCSCRTKVWFLEPTWQFTIIPTPVSENWRPLLASRPLYTCSVLTFRQKHSYTSNKK